MVYKLRYNSILLQSITEKIIMFNLWDHKQKQEWSNEN